jgi:Kef-type K+ transport system membrane component KefB
VNGVDRLSTPIIALFFILVGFKIDLSMLLSGTILLIILYSLARGTGKSIGSYITARLAKMPDAITNNIPYALLTQAGVAVGLAAFAYSRLLDLRIEQATLTAITLLDVVAVSVVIAEIIGPLLLKYSLRQAGELGLSINNSQVDQYCEDD